MSNLLWFQLLSCEDLLLLFILCCNMLFLVLKSCLDKTHLDHHLVPFEIVMGIFQYLFTFYEFYGTKIIVRLSSKLTMCVKQLTESLFPILTFI